MSAMGYTLPMTDEQLQRYVGAVEKVRSARAEVLDPALRRKIAEELGLTAEDLAAGAAAGEADLVRAEGCIERGAWDEAMRCATSADALLPEDARVAYALARAAWGRWRDAHADADRERALAECRRALELDARHQGAYALMGEIEAGRKLRTRRRLVIVAAAVFASAAASAAVYAYVRAPKRPACPDGGSYCTVAAPVRALDLGDGVELGPATLNVTPRGVRLDLSGRLTHRGTTELTLMRIGVQLLDGHAKEVGRLTIDAQPAFAPPLRPGDSHTFYLSEQVPQSTRAAQLIAGEKRSEPSAASYGAPQPLPVTYDPPAPEHLAITAGYRSRNARSYEGKTAVEGVIEVQNTGRGVIRQLELQVQGVDADGKPVGGPGRETVAYGNMPPMLPDEKRTVKTFMYVQGAVASEKVIVSKIE
jgi:hypothetical protein